MMFSIPLITTFCKLAILSNDRDRLPSSQKAPDGKAENKTDPFLASKCHKNLDNENFDLRFHGTQAKKKTFFIMYKVS